MRGARGLTLAETLVAVFLLGIAILMTCVVVAGAERLERRALRHALAIDVATSEAERMRSLPYGSVRDDEQDLGDVPGLSDLPDGRMTVSVVEEDEELALKVVRIVVAWKGRDPGRVQVDTAVGSLGLYR